MQVLRTTTGQRVVISYDPTKNALTFHETGWFAEPFRSSAASAQANTARPRPPREAAVTAFRRRCAA